MGQLDPRTGIATGLGQWLARTGKLSEDSAVQLAGEIRALKCREHW